MTISQAINTLRQPLVFGNPEQIKAARFLESRRNLRLTMGDFLLPYDPSETDDEDWPGDEDTDDECDA